MQVLRSITPASRCRPKCSTLATAFGTLSFTRCVMPPSGFYQTPEEDTEICGKTCQTSKTIKTCRTRWTSMARHVTQTSQTFKINFETPSFMKCATLLSGFYQILGEDTDISGKTSQTSKTRQMSYTSKTCQTSQTSQTSKYDTLDKLDK